MTLESLPIVEQKYSRVLEVLDDKKAEIDSRLAERGYLDHPELLEQLTLIARKSDKQK